jgi:pimeloyl-ACP methyl ester carboxylesterase
MIGWFHRWQSELVDATAFAGIGFWQLLGRAGRHGPQEWDAYAESWRQKGVGEFYRAPEKIPGPLVSGRQQISSPIPCDREENNTVHLRVWPGREGLKSPAMILLHSLFSASDVGYVHWASVLNRLGWTAIFYDLPYHYRRRPKGTWSGELVFGGNLIRSAETIRQAVAETRMVARMAREAGAPRVGLWGMSLGGWVASLTLCHEPDLTCAWLVQPIPDVGTAIWDSPGGWVIRRQMEARGLRREQASRMLPMVCPSFGKPKVSPDKILLVGGRYDRIARPAQLQNLAKEWGGVHYREVGQGHIGYQAMPMAWRWGTEVMPDLFERQG